METYHKPLCLLLLTLEERIFAMCIISKCLEANNPVNLTLVCDEVQIYEWIFDCIEADGQVMLCVREFIQLINLEYLPDPSDPMNFLFL